MEPSVGRLGSTVSMHRWRDRPELTDCPPPTGEILKTAHFCRKCGEASSQSPIRDTIDSTFYVSELRGGTGVRHVLTFGSDLSNYYPNQSLKVFKPRSDAPERIVNYQDPQTHAVRYASSHRAFQQVDGVPVSITPIDLLGQKPRCVG